MALKGYYALCYNNHAPFGAYHKIVKEDRHTLPAAEMRPTDATFRRHKIYASVRWGSVARGPQTTVVSPKMQF